MCTALSLETNSFYFGRNLDIDCSYGEQVCVVPRNFPLEFRTMGTLTHHYAIIGMAAVVQNTPLFFDASNEHGLSMAGLNFPGNAYYPPAKENSDNVTPFEFITWILSQCKTVSDSRKLLERINLADIPFNDALPLSPLHWIICDRHECIVVESMRDGLHIHHNPVGVMTNNPPFEYQLFNLNNYRKLSVQNGENTFSQGLNLENYCQGLGGIGLPGDVSSMSRFVRIAFGRENSVCEKDEASSVNQFFHLLSSVEMIRGLCMTPHGKWDTTTYTSCINTDMGLYYYTTYDNRTIKCIDMHRENLDGGCLRVFPLITDNPFVYQN